MLRPEYNYDIPELTQLIARNAFPKISVVMTVQDELGRRSQVRRDGKKPFTMSSGREPA